MKDADWDRESKGLAHHRRRQVPSRHGANVMGPSGNNLIKFAVDGLRQAGESTSYLHSTHIYNMIQFQCSANFGRIPQKTEDCGTYFLVHIAWVFSKKYFVLCGRF
jgi:hypothetical protein